MHHQCSTNAHQCTTKSARERGSVLRIVGHWWALVEHWAFTSEKVYRSCRRMSRNSARARKSASRTAPDDFPRVLPSPWRSSPRVAQADQLPLVGGQFRRLGVTATPLRAAWPPVGLVWFPTVVISAPSWAAERLRVVNFRTRRSGVARRCRTASGTGRAFRSIRGSSRCGESAISW